MSAATVNGMVPSITRRTKPLPAQDGPQYPNPGSKPIVGPVGATDRTDVERLTWKVALILLLGVFAVGIVLSLVVGRSR